MSAQTARVGLNITHPYSFLFEEQQEYLREIDKAICDKRHLLIQTPSSTAKTTLLLSYFIAFQLRNYRTGIHINYLVKSRAHAKKAHEILTKLIQNQRAYDDAVDKIKFTLFDEGNNDQQNMKNSDELLKEMGLDINVSTSLIAIDSQERYLSAKVKADIQQAPQKQNGSLTAHYDIDEMMDHSNGHDRNDTPPAEITINFYEEIATLDILCTNVLSRQLTDRIVRRALRQLRGLQDKIVYTRNVNAAKLDEEYKHLAERLKENRFSESNTQFLENDHRLISLIQYLLNYFKFRQRKFEKRKPAPSQSLTSEIRNLGDFIKELVTETVISQEILRELKTYFEKLLQKHRLELHSFRALAYVLEFVSSCIRFYEQYEIKYRNSFKVFYPSKNDLDLFLFRVVCLEPRIVFDRFVNPCHIHFRPQKPILIMSTSGPIHESLLWSHFKIQLQEAYYQKKDSSITHVVRRKLNHKQLSHQNLLVLNATCNAFEVDLKSSDDPETEHYKQIQWNYGLLLHELCDYVPDGIVVYVSSETYMQSLLKEWEKENILSKIQGKKFVFVEEATEEKNLQNIENFKKACDVGRGGVFIFNCRSTAAGLYEFGHHYSNLIYFIGYPIISSSLNEDLTPKLVQTSSATIAPILPMNQPVPDTSQQQQKVIENLNYLQAREQFAYLHPHHQKKRSEEQFAYLEQDAMRHVNKCLSNGLGHSKFERKAIIFADSRFNVKIVPEWLAVKEGNLNISQTVEKAREFLRGYSEQQVNSEIKSKIRRVTG